MNTPQKGRRREWHIRGQTEHGAALLRRPKALAWNVVLPQPGMRGGRRKQHPLLTLFERGFGALAPGHLQQQIAQDRDHHAKSADRCQHELWMPLPQRRVLEQDHRIGWEVLLGKVPTLELSRVDPVGVRGAHARRERARVLAIQNVEHEIARLGAHRLEGNHVSPHHSPAEVGVVGTIDGSIRGVCDLGGDVDRQEVLAGPVPEDRKRDDDRIARQICDFLQERIAWQADQIPRLELLFLLRELIAGNPRPSLVERRSARDHDEVPGVRLKSLGQRYRLGNVELADEARRIARQIDVGKRCRRRAAEHDRNVGKQKTAIVDDLPEAVGTKRHHDIERGVRVLFCQIPNDALPVPVVRELRKIEKFPMRLDVLGRALQQALANGFTDDEGRAVYVAVGIKNEHAPRGLLAHAHRRSRSTRPIGAENAQGGCWRTRPTPPRNLRPCSISSSPARKPAQPSIATRSLPTKPRRGLLVRSDLGKSPCGVRS